MKILFDQGTPVPLRQHLAEHSVHTAFELGWSNLRNSVVKHRATTKRLIEERSCHRLRVGSYRVGIEVKDGTVALLNSINLMSQREFKRGRFHEPAAGEEAC